MHACETNEIFLLVGDIFARICTSIADDDVADIPREVSVPKALAPYDNYVRNLWWEVATSPDEIDTGSFSITLQELVRESWGLLSVALDLKGRGLVDILSEEYFSRTIGMFEQNNVGIRLPNPVGELTKIYTDVCRPLPEEQQNQIENLKKDSFEATIPLSELLIGTNEIIRSLSGSAF